MSLCPPNILVVEDHAHMRAFLALMLDGLGYRYELACDGAEALVTAARASFDVLLTDVYLPEMSGWELVRQLDAHADLPALVISMSAGRSDVEAAYSKAAGCHVHLQKPFLIGELGRSLKKFGTFALGQEKPSA